MKSELPPFVSLNGKLVAANRARISVFDRGFLYGDGLFETLRSYHGALVGLDDHLARLRTSAAALGIPVHDRPWATEIQALLRANRLLRGDAAVRITLTRGPAAPGLLPPAKPTPTVLIVATPVPAGLPAEQRRGVQVILLPFAKLGFLAEYKLTDYVLAILGRVAARERGAQEGLYVHDGQVIEGTTSNLFICRAGQLITPPVKGLLPGVTRGWVLDLATRHGLEVVERPVSVRTLRTADEAFITSSIVEVLPVIGVDGRSIGGGRVGPLTRRMQRLYRQLINQIAALERA